jgi:tetratricopeptide (TPR) repeat protein
MTGQGISLQVRRYILMTEKATISPSDAIADFKEGVALMKNGYPQRALPRLRNAFEFEQRNPYYLSFLGLCIARAERKWDRACELCEIAVQLKRSEVQFHLNLAEAYQLAGRRSRAIDALDAALELFNDDQRLKRARGRIEKRSAPVLSFLDRNNVLNKQLGKWRHRALSRVKKQD